MSFNKNWSTNPYERIEFGSLHKSVLSLLFQAAELAEIARQESELAAARLEELSHSGSTAEVPEADAR